MDDKYELNIYENVGATPDAYIKEMSAWAKKLEREGKIARVWCIQDNRIQVIGDVTLGDEPIRYPFGVVGGFFECKEEYKNHRIIRLILVKSIYTKKGSRSRSFFSLY